MHTAKGGAAPRLLQVEGEVKAEVEVKVEVKVEAKGCFCRVVETARRQGAKSLELRAVLSLSRLWREQGKHKAA